jgi:hypothetical protein
LIDTKDIYQLDIRQPCVGRICHRMPANVS